MKHGNKWAVGLGITVAVLGAASLTVIWWLPTDKELAASVATKVEQRLGVKVTIESVQWALFPKPIVVINNFRTQQAQPVIIGRLRAHPGMPALMQRKLVFERVEIDDAVFPTNSVRAFHIQDAGDGKPLQHFAFRNLTWISYAGIPVAYDGEIDFDPHWRPRHAELRRPGIKPAFALTLTRESAIDRWQTLIHVAGGTAHGNVSLKTAANGVLYLSGQLSPRNIEVESAVRSFNRRSPLGGMGSGQTVLSANGRSVGELARSLHTRTMFSVTPATVLRFDLDKAIRTLGKERDGQTALQELTGQLDTQNTDQGLRATYTALKARAGKYTATGETTVYRSHIEGSGTLYLVEGTIGLPFSVNGPVNQPKATIPPGALAGAVIGTKILPGIGTVIGTRIGGAIGKLTKGKTQQPATPTPVAPKKN